jgi:hypothetical protein
MGDPAAPVLPLRPSLNRYRWPDAGGGTAEPIMTKESGPSPYTPGRHCAAASIGAANAPASAKTTPQSARASFIFRFIAWHPFHGAVIASRRARGEVSTRALAGRPC